MRKINVFVAIWVLIVLSAPNGYSQDRTADRQIIEAKKLIQQGTDQASENFLRQAENLLLHCDVKNEHAPLIEYYRGYIDYNRSVVIYRMDKEKASAYLDSAADYLEKAVERDGAFAEAHALLASCFGMKISFSPFKAVWLGPKSSSEKNKALSLSPQNPRVALLGAIGTYNTPSLFGGGKDKGLEELHAAAALFDKWKPSDPLQPDWGHEQVYAWIGMAHLDRNETALARKAFEKALEINPNYGWVKYVLMPKLETGTSSH
jgi:tetratricopeptide (TPR) repeat protein